MLLTTFTLLGWVDATTADRCKLTLAKVDAVDGVTQVIANVTPHVAHAYDCYSCIQVKFAMEVKEDLSWTLQVGKRRIASDNIPLAALPQTLNSVSKVRRLIEGLETLKFCTGNEDEKYFPVQAARKGLFKDPTGVISCVFKKQIVTICNSCRISTGGFTCEGSLWLQNHSLHVL